MTGRLDWVYRTISFEMAMLLDGLMPWDLEASSLAALYWYCRKALVRGVEREFNVDHPSRH